MSTKEQVEELVTLATIGDTVALRREAIAKLATLARSAAPSGQVAEDEALLVGALEHLNAKAGLLGFENDKVDAAARRLAVGAQRAQQAEAELAQLRQMYEAAVNHRDEALRAVEVLEQERATLATKVAAMELLRAEVAALKATRDSADVDFSALSYALATRGAVLPECRSAGGIVIAGAVHDLRAEIKRLSERTEGPESRLLSAQGEVASAEALAEEQRKRAEKAEAELAAILERAEDRQGLGRALHEYGERPPADHWEDVRPRGQQQMIEQAGAVARWVLHGDTPSDTSADMPASEPRVTQEDFARLKEMETRSTTRVVQAHQLLAEVGLKECSPSCTHDEARNQWPRGRVEQRSEAFKGDAETCQHNVDRRDTCRECEFENGAEAMRTACLNAVQQEMERRGASREDWESMEAAIKGLVP